MCPREPTSTSGACFDSTGAYRYALWRSWDDALPRVAFLLLNPSTADAERDDPTIRRCIAYARQWGFGSLHVVNLFAYRATNPRDLLAAPDPVGPDNDAHLLEATRAATLTVAGWGLHGRHNGRAAAVRSLLSARPLHTLALTASGEPRHPLYLPAVLRPTPWVP